MYTNKGRPNQQKQQNTRNLPLSLPIIIYIFTKIYNYFILTDKIACKLHFKNAILYNSIKILAKKAVFFKFT